MPRAVTQALSTRHSHDPLADLGVEVREAVRRSGIDPLHDHADLRRLVSDVLHAHDQRSLTGAVAPLPDRDAVADSLVSSIGGFGPLQEYLDDPSVEEIWINEPSRVFVARRGRHELTTTVLDSSEVDNLVERMLKTTGRRVDVSSPFVDATLPDGSRVHVVLAGVSRSFTAVNIRKFSVRPTRLADLVELGTLTADAAAYLAETVSAGDSIVVCGGTQCGKTTTLNVLASTISGSQRVISCEEVFELGLAHPDWVALQTRQAGLEGTGQISLRTLVKESLRMRPSWIVVGEVRAEEAFDLLLALNAGMPGLATVHANSAREALMKLCTLPLLAGENISSRFVVPTVASAVDVLVHVGMTGDGQRRVEEIVAVPGRVEGDVIETETVFARRNGRLERVGGHVGPFSRMDSAARADSTAWPDSAAWPDTKDQGFAAGMAV